jgi:hypothetical protein
LPLGQSESVGRSIYSIHHDHQSSSGFRIVKVLMFVDRMPKQLYTVWIDFVAGP